MAAIVTPSHKKRSRGSPTGNTLQQKLKQPVRRGAQSSKRRLTYGGDKKETSSHYATVDNWSLAEDCALVQFILLHCDETSWISTRKTKFWENVSEFVHRVCGIKRRTSNRKLQFSVYKV